MHVGSDLGEVVMADGQTLSNISEELKAFKAKCVGII